MPEVSHEDDVINYALERLVHFGDISKIPVDKEKFREIAKLIQAGGVSSENILKAVTELVAQATFFLEQQNNERSAKSKVMVDVTVKSVIGMTITEEVRNRIAKVLETNPKFSGIMNKAIDDFDDDDFNLFENYILYEAFSALLYDDKTLGYFNNSLIEAGKEPFELGDKNFLAAKDIFIKDVVTYMRDYRGQSTENMIRTVPYDEPYIFEMLKKAALSVVS